jgi:glycosyltransferase involved in cell wall biosynthesis
VFVHLAFFKYIHGVLMRVLLVGMADSSHVARWIHSCSLERGLDILLIPTSPHRRIHPGLQESGTNLANAGGSLKIHQTLKFLSLPVFVLDMFFANRVRGWFIRKSILTFAPDLIHVMETQNGAYPLQLALRNLKNSGFVSPKVLLTLFGSDLFWFSKFERHRKKIAEVLPNVDYLALECERDKKLANQFGFRGSYLPIGPVARGIPENQIYVSEDKTNRRGSIAIKGYSGKWGQAPLAIQAVSLSSDHLTGMVIEIFSAEPGAIRAAKKFLKPLGIKYILHKKGRLSHPEVLELLRRSELYIGLSRSDGLPSSMLEAMSQGAFPIQTATACVDGWIQDEVNGYVVADVTPQAVSRLVTKALSDRRLLESARKLNYDIISRRYSIKENSPATEPFYKALVPAT